MAAGKGVRLAPVTNKIPKPLISVNGKAIIDTIIDALYQNQIFDIYIVVGYKKEMFYAHFSDQPNIKLIENPYFDTCNNISSLYVARDYIGDSFILDGDQIINNPSILNPAFEKSGYSCIWTTKHTDEWLLTTHNNTVTSCSRTGGENGWQLFSLSRWTTDDAHKLQQHLETEFENKNTDIYWDDVAIFLYPKCYSLGVYEINEGDIVEIDTLKELIEIDSTYKKYEQ